MGEKNNKHDWVSKLSHQAIQLVDELKANIELDPGDIAYNSADMTWQVGTDDKPIKIADEDITSAVFDTFDNAITNTSGPHAEGTCTRISSGLSSHALGVTNSTSASSLNGVYANMPNITWKAIIEEEEKAYWKEQFDGSHYCNHCGRDALLDPDGNEVLSEYCPYCGKRCL